jgi:hypothetical protein
MDHQKRDEDDTSSGGWGDFFSNLGWMFFWLSWFGD